MIPLIRRFCLHSGQPSRTACTQSPPRSARASTSSRRLPPSRSSPPADTTSGTKPTTRRGTSASLRPISCPTATSASLIELEPKRHQNAPKSLTKSTSCLETASRFYVQLFVTTNINQTLKLFTRFMCNHFFR